MNIRAMVQASSFLMAGAIVAFLPQLGDAAQKQKAAPPEKECQAASPSVSNSQCTISTDPVPADHMCAAQGGHVITAISCSDTVTTTADDQCDGPDGECTPPTFIDTELASSSEKADPNLSVGACASAGQSCTCTANGSVTYTWGRKKC